MERRALDFEKVQPNTPNHKKVEIRGKARPCAMEKSFYRTETVPKQLQV